MNSNDATPSWHSSDAILRGVNGGSNRSRGTSIRIRDRDQIFGKDFVDQVKAMGIKQVLSAPRCPWQRAYIERLIGSIRRECLDHVIVFGESSLHRTLTTYFAYYHEWRLITRFKRTGPSSDGSPSRVVMRGCASISGHCGFRTFLMAGRSRLPLAFGSVVRVYL